MTTVNGWSAGGEGVRVRGEMSVKSVGEMVTSVQTFFNPFLKILTTGAGNLFQCFTHLTEKAEALLRRWLLPWATL